MNLNYTWIENNILIEIKETLDLEVLLEANAVIFSNPRFDFMNYLILDLSKVGSANITIQEMKAFSLLHKSAVRWNNSILFAIVTANQQIQKNFELYIREMNWTTWKCKIFEHVEHAKEWCLEQPLTKIEVKTKK